MSLPPVVRDALAILSASNDEEYEAAVQRAIASGLLWDGDDAPDPRRLADDVLWIWELLCPTEAKQSQSSARSGVE